MTLPGKKLNIPTLLLSSFILGGSALADNHHLISPSIDIISGTASYDGTGKIFHKKDLGFGISANLNVHQGHVNHGESVEYWVLIRVTGNNL